MLTSNLHTIDRQMNMCARVVTVVSFAPVGTKPPEMSTSSYHDDRETTTSATTTTASVTMGIRTTTSDKPSIELETLSIILHTMDGLLPQLESCCCGHDMPDNQTSVTPPYGDGKTLLISTHCEALF